MVERCLAAYRASGVRADQEYSTGIWAYIYGEQARNHRIFADGSVEEASAILRDPAASRLFYGFDHISPEFTAALTSSPGERKGVAFLWQDYLIRLAEAVAALRIENPEGETPWLQYGDLTTDQLLDSIERRLGCGLTFPNPFPNEFGLESSRGLVAYRAIQAIYLSFRVKSMVRHLQNPKVLEIGAGLGRSAYYARLMGISDYTIIDLPLTGISQAYYLMRVCGEDAVQLRGERDTPARDKIKILDPSYFLESDIRYDLVVNMDSLTEMSQGPAESYIRKASQVAPQFLSINHEVNPFTFASLVDENARILRFPYWLRPGYVEEIVTFR